MVEENQAEEFKVGVGIRFGAVYKLKGRGKFPVETDRDVVYHSRATEDFPVPVLPWHLFLSDLVAGHLDGSPPGVFDKTVGDLSLGRIGNDLRLVVVDPPEALTPHDFVVEVSVESVGEMNDVGQELGEGVDDFIGRGVIEAVEPAVLGCYIK